MSKLLDAARAAVDAWDGARQQLGPWGHSMSVSADTVSGSMAALRKAIEAETAAVEGEPMAEITGFEEVRTPQNRGYLMRIEELKRERAELARSLTAATARIAELEAGLRHTLEAMKSTVGWCDACRTAAALLDAKETT